MTQQSKVRLGWAAVEVGAEHLCMSTGQGGSWKIYLNEGTAKAAITLRMKRPDPLKRKWVPVEVFCEVSQ